MFDANYVECWMIGGPWNNRLATLHRRFLEPGACFRASVPADGFSIAPISACPLDVSIETADYYRQVSLETGVPVFSCLEDARYGGYYHAFDLRSVRQRLV
jgi:hypothetical protein